MRSDFSKPSVATMSPPKTQCGRWRRAALSACGYYNQHPHWGPFFEQHGDGDIKLRVGDWILGFGSP